MRVCNFICLCVATLCFVSINANISLAQVFLRQNDGEQNARSSGSSVILRDRNSSGSSSTSPADRYRERMDRRNSSAGAQAGQSYSIEQYNRMLLEQRNSARGGRSTNRSPRSGQGYYPDSYLNRNVERVRTNPFTGRYSTQSEIDEMIKAREAYYRTHTSLTPKKRTRTEEQYFNKHGYYQDDGKLIKGADGSLNQRQFGSSVNVGNARGTSQEYIDRANRFRNNGN